MILSIRITIVILTTVSLSKTSAESTNTPGASASGDQTKPKEEAENSKGRSAGPSPYGPIPTDGPGSQNGAWTPNGPFGPISSNGGNKQSFNFQNNSNSSSSSSKQFSQTFGSGSGPNGGPPPNLMLPPNGNGMPPSNEMSLQNRAPSRDSMPPAPNNPSSQFGQMQIDEPALQNRPPMQNEPPLQNGPPLQNRPPMQNQPAVQNGPPIQMQNTQNGIVREVESYYDASNSSKSSSSSNFKKVVEYGNSPSSSASSREFSSEQSMSKIDHSELADESLEQVEPQYDQSSSLSSSKMRYRNQESEELTASRRGHRHRSKTEKYMVNHCRKKPRRINEIHDLRRHRSELNCIFRKGHAPNKIPEGRWHGAFIKILQSHFFSAFGDFIWHGKMTIKATCNGKPSFIGWNNVMSQPAFPFKVRIGRLDEPLGHGEYEDNEDSLILDYTKDFSQVCPDFKWISNERKSMHNFMKFNQIIDAIRIVGRKRDGSQIYLGKMYVRENHGEKRVKNFAYFAVTNYDPEVYPVEKDVRDSDSQEEEEEYEEEDGHLSMKQPMIREPLAPLPPLDPLPPMQPMRPN